IPDVDDFHNLYKIANVSTGKDDGLHDIFELHYIELDKFAKEYHELASALDRWSIFFTRAHEIDKAKIPKELAADKAITKAINAVDRMFDEEERQVYEDRMHALADVESKIASAEENGLKRGLEKGMEKGMRQKSLSIAKSLLDVLDVETIALKTGLGMEEIEKLKSRKKNDC
ncbi:MAG: Rpn family recombination-promoting nuclease/putative transposase, partial [Gammaproteobacteria bacterium]|nr:Rpn family recombination-promoting nuclease/putative transposase [Gammaproteobacteria bacterium]